LPLIWEKDLLLLSLGAEVIIDDNNNNNNGNKNINNLEKKLHVCPCKFINVTLLSKNFIISRSWVFFSTHQIAYV
jgi:hypothetical protein